MTSKVYRRLCLYKDAPDRVNVVGPILQWDADEVSAVFHVVIAQANGGIVTATGSSTISYTNPTPNAVWTPPPDEDWHATAQATNGQLTYGPATAYVTAVIDGVYGQVLETYTWTVLTRLIRCNEHGQEIDD